MSTYRHLPRINKVSICRSDCYWRRCENSCEQLCVCSGAVYSCFCFGLFYCGCVYCSARLFYFLSRDHKLLVWLQQACGQHRALRQCFPAAHRFSSTVCSVVFVSRLSVRNFCSVTQSQSQITLLHPRLLVLAPTAAHMVPAEASGSSVLLSGWRHLLSSAAATCHLLTIDNPARLPDDLD